MLFHSQPTTHPVYMGVRRGGQGGLLPPPPGKFLPSPGKKSADAHASVTCKKFHWYPFVTSKYLSRNLFIITFFSVLWKLATKEHFFK